MRLEIKIVLTEGNLAVTESGTDKLLLSTMVVDPRMGEEAARLVAKIIGTRIADAIAEQAGIEVGHGG